MAQTISGSIEQDDLSGSTIDRDFYKVTLTGGHRYNFSASANISGADTLNAVAIRLRDANGNLLSPDKFADSATPTFTYDVLGSGNQTYYLAISAGGSGAFQDKTGAYSVSLSEIPATTADTVGKELGTAASLSAGATISGTIDQFDLNGDPIDADYYQVSLIGGHRYTFTANANVSTSDTLDQVFVRLRDSNGNKLTPDKGGAEGPTPTFTFDTPGSGITTFYLAVSAGGPGAFENKIGSASRH